MAKSKFVEAFERGTRGMDALSSGVCPGCPQCADDFGYRCEENEDGEEELEEERRARFTADLESGKIVGEGHFSWDGCDLCGSPLGGDREVYHWRDEQNRLWHGDGCCVDCILYMANGEEPEEWGDTDEQED